MSEAENEMEEVEVVVVTMHNDDGEEEEFELIDVVEVNGGRYGVFIPFEEDEDEEAEGTAAKPESKATDGKEEDDEEEEGLLILKLVKDGDSEEFETIEDDAEFEAVAKEVDRLIAEGALQ